MGSWRSGIILVCLVSISLLDSLNGVDSLNEDKLHLFYERIKQSDVKYCPDRTRMLPECTVCIPGLQQSLGSDSCDTFVKESVNIRNEIGKLTSERYGAAVLKSSRPFGLYPCESQFESN